ncbi:MAG: acetyltransferase [Gammaproteobacteria bacterium]|nr:acetyltransferase [Gammaproteobacteria bacterium]
MLGLLLYTLNLLISFTLVLIILPFSLMLPPAKRLLLAMPRAWTQVNRLILQLTTKTQLNLQLPEGLSTKKYYLVTANHQTWTDIIVLFNTFSGRIPLLKFFLKQQLRWVPLVGQTCWIYGFPFLYRKGSTQRDIASTRKACERFKKDPGSLMIFAEGTRFTPQKHKTQRSPYKHLLKPKAGGMAIALECMGDKINTLLDTTIIYPEVKPTFWNFCRGKYQKISVIVREIPLTKELRGDYEKDLNYRKQFQQFLNQVWAQKDEHF